MCESYLDPFLMENIIYNEAKDIVYFVSLEMKPYVVWDKGWSVCFLENDHDKMELIMWLSAAPDEKTTFCNVFNLKQMLIFSKCKPYNMSVELQLAALKM